MQIQVQSEIGVLGGGCFWCLEAIFMNVKGIVCVESGYAGGKTKDPAYAEVCTGETGHAEVVRISFDPQIISYKELLTIFFTIHDPTTINRQGADIGTQYRSVIFYATEQQKETASEFIRQENGLRKADEKIVTEVEPLTVFYKAGSHHHEYFKNNKNQPYCRFVIAPKIEKFILKFPGYLKK